MDSAVWIFAILPTAPNYVGAMSRFRNADARDHQLVMVCKMIQEPEQQILKPIQGRLNSFGAPCPELWALLASKNVAVDDIHDNPDEINTMISEGGPIR